MDGGVLLLGMESGHRRYEMSLSWLEPKGMNPETRLMQKIRLAVGALPGTRIFRNNVGVAQFPDGRPVRYGLCPGSSDLIGWTVRRGRAIFLAIEVKCPGERVTNEQGLFLKVVNGAGGIGFVATSAEEALEKLNAR